MEFKNILLSTTFLTLFLLPNFSFAQEKIADKKAFQNHELGLQLVGLDNFDFDFLYKKQVANNAYRRIGLAFASLSVQNVGDNGSGNFTVGINLGREKRKTINEKLKLVHGAAWLFNSSLNASSNNSFSTFSTGFGIILGVQYKIGDSFYIGAEIFPCFTTSFVINDGFNNLSFNGGFNSRSVGLSVVYQFETE